MDPFLMLIISTIASVGIVYRYIRQAFLGFLAAAFLEIILMWAFIQIEIGRHEHKPIYGAACFLIAVFFSPVSGLISCFLIQRSQRIKKQLD